MGSRRRSREIAVQVLYQLELNAIPTHQAIDLMWKAFDPPRSARAFAEKLVAGVRNRLEDLDKRIADFSENWRLERMAPVDRSILRLAVYEMMFCEDIPPRVSINEAVELAKRFGSEQSGAFINGILDRIYKSGILPGSDQA